MSSDVQRSCTVHAPDVCATAIRRSPLLSLTLSNKSPLGVTPGCTIGTPSHLCSQSSLPSPSETLLAPLEFTSTICCTPSIVTSCGELYPEPPEGPCHRGLPVARSYAMRLPDAATMTRSLTTSGEPAMPQPGTFVLVSFTELRVQTTAPVVASSTFTIPVAPCVYTRPLLMVGVARGPGPAFDSQKRA